MLASMLHYYGSDGSTVRLPLHVPFSSSVRSGGSLNRRQTQGELFATGVLWAGSESALSSKENIYETCQSGTIRQLAISERVVGGMSLVAPHWLHAL